MKRCPRGGRTGIDDLKDFGRIKCTTQGRIGGPRRIDLDQLASLGFRSA